MQCDLADIPGINIYNKDLILTHGDGCLACLFKAIHVSGISSHRHINNILIFTGRICNTRNINFLIIIDNSCCLLMFPKLFRMICRFVKILPDAVSNVFFYHNNFSEILDLIILICPICHFRPDKAISVYPIDSCSSRRLACYKILVFAQIDAKPFRRISRINDISLNISDIRCVSLSMTRRKIVTL